MWHVLCRGETVGQAGKIGVKGGGHLTLAEQAGSLAARSPPDLLNVTNLTQL